MQIGSLVVHQLQTRGTHMGMPRRGHVSSDAAVLARKRSSWREAGGGPAAQAASITGSWIAIWTRKTSVLLAAAQLKVPWVSTVAAHPLLVISGRISMAPDGSRLRWRLEWQHGRFRIRPSPRSCWP